MVFANYTINDFLNEIDSPTPTPGGGSVASIVMAQGVSLIRMVAHLSIAKQKFKTLNEQIQNEYFAHFNQLEKDKQHALLLSDADTLAYNEVVLAYRLPKITDDDKVIRTKAIDKAIIKATEVPFQVLELGRKIIIETLPMFEYASKSALSDFGVGLKLIEAGMYSAMLNVETNMASFNDQKIAEYYLFKAREIIEEANVKIEPYYQKVRDAF